MKQQINHILNGKGFITAGSELKIENNPAPEQIVSWRNERSV